MTEGAPAVADLMVLRSSTVSLDLHTRRAMVAGRSVDLTARESALLEALLRRSGEVLSREDLLGQVWGYDVDPRSNVVNMCISALRRKLGPDVVVTVRREGYLIRF